MPQALLWCSLNYIICCHTTALINLSPHYSEDNKIFITFVSSCLPFEMFEPTRNTTSLLLIHLFQPRGPAGSTHWLLPSFIGHRTRHRLSASSAGTPQVVGTFLHADPSPVCLSQINHFNTSPLGAAFKNSSFVSQSLLLDRQQCGFLAEGQEDLCISSFPVHFQE